ncbi:MAG: nucleotidyl transferase AbiEii/AbiGii toxin family protein [Bacteroidota bacterium]
MILQREIIQCSKKLGVPPATIDKDWVLGHVLNAMYSFDDIRKNLMFKGGTCLKKCYFENYRFSEDLDFTLINKDFKIDTKFLKKILQKAVKISGIKFDVNAKIKNQVHHDVEQGYEVNIRFWGADHKPNQKPLAVNRWQTAIKFDISFSEQLISSPCHLDILHEYTDKDLIAEKVTCYSLQEIVSEKLRSLAQRNRPRDIYDNWYFSQYINTQEYPGIKELLIRKAKQKNIDVSDINQLINEKKRELLERAWEKSLQHQIKRDELPPFEVAYDSLQTFIENILNA